MRPLPRSFYEPSAEAVAPLLLGHWLIRNLPSGPCGGPIVEAEAYLADDPASHGFGGETARNRAMYGPPGRAYVYLIYGFHFCVNAVCRPAAQAEAVLIRAIEAEFGLELMRQNRHVPSAIQLTNGPGKLCAALAIDPHCPESHMYLGIALLAQGDLTGALAEYQKALEANPQSSLASYRIGEVLFSQRNYQASVNAYRDALRGDDEPRWTEVWSHIALGKIFDLTGQRDRAVNEYRLAVQTNDNTQGAVNEARLYLQKPFLRPENE